MEKNNLTADNILNALFITNGDPMLIEAAEDAEYVLNFIEESEDLIAVLPDDDDFADICARLGLSDANDPQKVYKIIGGNGAEIGYIAFANDWELA